MDPNTLYPVVQKRPPPITSVAASPRIEHKALHSQSTYRTMVDIMGDFISEEEEDLADALSPMNDMMKISKTWWFLEWIPQNLRYQNDDDSWAQKLT